MTPLPWRIVWHAVTSGTSHAHPNQIEDGTGRFIASFDRSEDAEAVVQTMNAQNSKEAKP